MPLEPAMCFNKGLCIEKVDSVRFETAIHIKSLRSLGHEVERLNLARDIYAFMACPRAIIKLQQDRILSFPYILINNNMARSGTYPDNAQ